MIWEFFLPVVSFLGLIIGIILAKVSPEEMKPGKKYFLIFEKVITALIILTLFYYSEFNIIFLIVGAALGYFIRANYIYFGLALASSFLVSKSSVLLIASLIFILGLPYGTLFESGRKSTVKKFLNLIAMFFFPFIILIFPDYINPSYALGLCSGLLIWNFIKAKPLLRKLDLN